jgi:radical SAM superfamily enzyme YgiQ (UPF0313 family)
MIATKIVIASVNSKFIHINLAIRYLQKYLAKIAPDQECVVKEFNINLRFIDVLRELYETKPDLLLFSIYIWNVDFTLKLIREFKKISPQTRIVVGGPEVMYRKEALLGQYPEIETVLVGDGETSLAAYLGLKVDIPDCTSLDYIPFPYDDADIERTRNQILYYESSRGCPFACAYCLSSIDRQVRYFSLARVLADIDFFMQRNVKLVKFVDRTFNLNPQRYLAVWQHIINTHNGVTTFHFELAGDLLTPEALALLQTAPPKALQFEVGIQSAHLPTLKAISRTTDLAKLKANLLGIGDNIHMHVDLIAGLPLEDFATFGLSFDYAMSLKPEMMQLGFLKILSGTEMESLAKQDARYMYLSHPPYEITATPWVPFEDMMLLKDIDKTVDIYYNSGRHTLANTSFSFFKDLAKHLRETGVFSDPRRPEYYATALTDYLNA